MSTRDAGDPREFLIEGMTCAHCASAVREEVAEVAGVTGVDVDLDSGRMTVNGTGFSDDAVREAVAGAGYAVAG